MRTLTLTYFLTFCILAQCAPLGSVNSDQILSDAVDSTKETANYFRNRLIESNEKLAKALDKFIGITTKFLNLIYKETGDLFEQFKLIKYATMVLFVGIVISCIVFPIVFMMTMILVACIYCQKSGLEIARAEMEIADRKRQRLALFRQKQVRMRAQLLSEETSKGDSAVGKNSDVKEASSSSSAKEDKSLRSGKETARDASSKKSNRSSDKSSSSKVTKTVRADQSSPKVTSKQSSVAVGVQDSGGVKKVDSSTSVKKN